MTSFLLLRLLKSNKKEVTIVLAASAVIMSLPIVALGSATNLPALAIDSTIKLFTGRASTKNTYDFGYCTFWTAQRRDEIGRAIPSNWGDAHSWDEGASKDDYKVDQTPTVGAIMQSNKPPLGHVAFVEKINSDGTWEISEMNYKGWDIQSSRILKASDAQSYNFIH